ncbi:A-kinase anchor protein 8-like isoform X1 [Neoarius graeffei]|uniref:A-kinase anchor protein 8-like isoform X1 n=1 Tax=Neoarius graeffei TaxID=443677 RepID=UPI00298D2B08|nr:A-kinase anchor protein 8-like isoform X1 [Neoarius graeffei]
MDGRGYGSGFSSWGGGSSSRGSGGYDLYGYKDSMSGGYGGGQMKRGLSGSLLSGGGSADDVIAKINQRLDMLTQLEGGMKGGGRNERFDQYESFDSRSSALGPRDLYRSGNLVFGDSRGDMMAQRGGMGFGAMGGAGGGGGFGGSASHGNAKMRHVRDAFSVSGWGAGQRSQHRGGGPGGRGFGRRQDSSMMVGGGRSGGQGHSPSGRGKLPSLLSHRMYPESGGFQPHHGSQDYPVRHFGGGKNLNRQRTRKRPLNRQPVKPQRDGQKKRKQTPTTADEPESKMGKTESEGDKADKADTAKAAEPKEKSDDATPATQESEAAAEGESADPAVKGETSQSVAKQQGKQTPPSASKLRKRRGFFESRAISRVTFACSVCKFRSFYSEDLTAHLESKFHKDHFRFLSSQLSKPTTEFLQEYINDKHKKTDQRISQLENHSATICQVLREQDLTREIGMEHFMKKVEAAYCSACDLYIPMQFILIQKHLKSPEHNYNRKGMMEQSKRSSLSVARSILNHKVIGKKLERYLKGENPFTDTQDDQDPEDSMMEVADGDAEQKREEKQEEAELTDVVGEPDVLGNGDGHEEEMKMEEGGGGEEERGEEGEEEGGEKEGEGRQEEGEGEEDEEDGVEVKEEEEEEDGVEAKEEEEEEEVDGVVENLLQEADDDCGIPVIED